MMMAGVLTALALFTPLRANPETPQQRVLIIVGAPGTPEYAKEFAEAAARWEKAARLGGAACERLPALKSADQTAKMALKSYLETTITVSGPPLWLVFLGHGTDDGKESRFNLEGPDLSPAELATWLQPARRPVATILGFSASGAFLKALSGPKRVVIAATRSGAESNHSRFGGFFAATWEDPRADLDQDGQVSLLEAYLVASAQVADFYKAAGRLATEHALLDDNGDGLGSPADWYQGIRPVKKAKDGAEADGQRAHKWHLIPSATERAMPYAIREKRDRLEIDLANLRSKKATLEPANYEKELERLLLQLGELYLDPSPGIQSGDKGGAAP